MAYIWRQNYTTQIERCPIVFSYWPDSFLQLGNMGKLGQLDYNRYMNKYTTKQKALFAAFCARHEITFNTMGEYYSALDQYFID